MKISMDIKPVSYLKSQAADILKQVNEIHRPAIIQALEGDKFNLY